MERFAHPLGSTLGPQHVEQKTPTKYRILVGILASRYIRGAQPNNLSRFSYLLLFTIQFLFAIALGMADLCVATAYTVSIGRLED